jgi:hypothetical protein
VDLKTILAIVLYLVIAGGAIYLYKRKENNRRAAKGADSRPFFATRKGAEHKNG